MERFLTSYYSLNSAVVVPKSRSVALMATSMAVHYFGYEFVRSAVFTLFTSRSSGFADSSPLTLAMACTSPFSVFLLVHAYGKTLASTGSPRITLRSNTLSCAAVLLLGCASLYGVSLLLDNNNNDYDNDLIRLKQCVVFSLFVFQNSYVGLLATQHWAFLGSVLTPEEGKLFFAPIAGLSSLSSTVAATAVSRIVVRAATATTTTMTMSTDDNHQDNHNKNDSSRIMVGLLLMGAGSLLLSAYAADRAYALSEQHGLFDTSRGDRGREKHNNNNTNTYRSLVRRAVGLFQRVPILSALFWEVVACGLLVSLLNFRFVLHLQEAVPDQDATRAAYLGKFHALVNAASGVLQLCGPMSYLLRRMEVYRVWVAMPVVVLFVLTCLPSFVRMTTMTTTMTTEADRALFMVALTYFTMKTMQYSVHGVACEMVYVSLDYESRFIGKEIIGLFGNRIGRSTISLTLSVVTKFCGGDMDPRHLSVLTLFFVLLWLLCGVRLKGSHQAVLMLNSRSDDGNSITKQQQKQCEEEPVLPSKKEMHHTIKTKIT